MDFSRINGTKTWLRKNYSKLRSSRRKQFDIILLFLFLGYSGIVPTVVASWSETNLNAEIGIVRFPDNSDGNSPYYTDANTSLWLVPRGPLDTGSWNRNDPLKSTFTTSEDRLLVYLWDKTYYPTSLHICYMEVLVNNGTHAGSDVGWSYNITSGNQSGEHAFSPAIIEIPQHPAKTTIEFRIRLLSTDFNHTYPTPTLINGMRFNYTVYYSPAEIAKDYNERQLVLGRAWLGWWLGLAGLVMVFAYPEAISDEKTDQEIVEVDDHKWWTQYFADRIDNIDRERHFLVTEIQVLIAILGAIAAFAFNQAASNILFSGSIILAIPLVITVIVLMMGPREEVTSRLVSGNLEVTSELFRESLARKRDFLTKCKKMMAGLSLFSVELVLLLAFSTTAIYNQIPVGLSQGGVVFLVLADLALLAYLLRAVFSKSSIESPVQGEC